MIILELFNHYFWAHFEVEHHEGKVYGGANLFDLQQTVSEMSRWILF